MILNTPYIGKNIPISSNKRIGKVKWTVEEEDKLQQLVNIHGKKWSIISKFFDNKTNYQCFYHFWKNLDPRNKKWTIDEDKKLMQYLLQNGTSWRTCGHHMKRNPKECFERYKFLKNEYNLDKMKVFWKVEDELKLLLLVSKIGKCWNIIKLCFPGKTKKTICKKFYLLLKNNVKNTVDPQINNSNYKLSSLMKYLVATIREKIGIIISKGDLQLIKEVIKTVEAFVKETTVSNSLHRTEKIKDNIKKSNEDFKSIIKKKIKEKIVNVLKQKISNLSENLVLEQSIDNFDTIFNKISKIKNILQNVKMAINI